MARKLKAISSGDVIEGPLLRRQSLLLAARHRLALCVCVWHRPSIRGEAARSCLWGLLRVFLAVQVDSLKSPLSHQQSGQSYCSRGGNRIRAQPLCSADRCRPILLVVDLLGRLGNARRGRRCAGKSFRQGGALLLLVHLDRVLIQAAYCGAAPRWPARKARIARKDAGGAAAARKS